jgi:hypothetical protein
MAQLKNTTINDTGFLQLPTGTTAQRPVSSQQGQLRYNTETRNVEWYDSTYNSWFPTGVVPPIATGGTITNITQGGVNYRVHTFTTTGTSTFTVTRGGQVEFLIVAGGGGGASRHGGGGGAGGVLQGSMQVNLGTYTIVVGAGGAGAAPASESVGSKGENSSAFSLTAFGGGAGGGASSTNSLQNGGSGGGSRGNSTAAPGAGTPGQGNIGGSGTLQLPENFGLGGGGGGAGSPGNTAEQLPRAAGGTGINSIITGTLAFYGGGGGGGGSGPPSTPQQNIGGLGGGGRGNTGTLDNAQSGTPNTGGGGGGGGHNGGINWTGKAGGSGIVIIRYRTS